MTVSMSKATVHCNFCFKHAEMPHNEEFEPESERVCFKGMGVGTPAFEGLWARMEAWRPEGWQVFMTLVGSNDDGEAFTLDNHLCPDCAKMVLDKLSAAQKTI